MKKTTKRLTMVTASLKLAFMCAVALLGCKKEKMRSEMAEIRSDEIAARYSVEDGRLRFRDVGAIREILELQSLDQEKILTEIRATDGFTSKLESQNRQVLARQATTCDCEIEG